MHVMPRVPRRSQKLFFLPSVPPRRKKDSERMLNENRFAKIFEKEVRQILHQSELRSFPVPFLAHSGDATPFRIQVDFKIASDCNE